jgi:prefoldin subunit 5
MKLKTLKKKIRRLETRLQEGPKKLAKLKGKLAALVKANAAKAKKKSTARTRSRP